MTISATIFGENDTLLPARPKLSEQERRAIEGRLLRATFGIVALGIVALYATDSFAPPSDPASQTIRSTPSPLL